MRQQLRVISRGGPQGGDILYSRILDDRFFSDPRIGPGTLIAEMTIDPAIIAAGSTPGSNNRRRLSAPVIGEFNTEFHSDAAAKIAWFQRQR